MASDDLGDFIFKLNLIIIPLEYNVDRVMVPLNRVILSATTFSFMADVAPRLRATGLPCIASPEITSSGNTQHLGTKNNCFIDTSVT